MKRLMAPLLLFSFLVSSCSTSEQQSSSSRGSSEEHRTSGTEEVSTEQFNACSAAAFDNDFTVEEFANTMSESLSASPEDTELTRKLFLTNEYATVLEQAPPGGQVDYYLSACSHLNNAFSGSLTDPTQAIYMGLTMCGMVLAQVDMGGPVTPLDADIQTWQEATGSEEKAESYLKVKQLALDHLCPQYKPYLP